MMNLANAIYFNRYSWSNQAAPKSNWDNDHPNSLRPYWGWNEVPVNRLQIRNMQYRDAIMIKLPAAICNGDGGDDSLKCLGKGQAQNLEGDLDLWVKDGILKPGSQNIAARPGSYVVIMREWMHPIQGFSGKDNWSRWIFCENWTSPSNKYQIVFDKISNTNPTGACYITQPHLEKENKVGTTAMV